MTASGLSPIGDRCNEVSMYHIVQGHPPPRLQYKKWGEVLGRRLYTNDIGHFTVSMMMNFDCRHPSRVPEINWSQTLSG